MKTTLSLLACFLGLLSSAKGQTTTATQGDPNERILNIEMRLSAYGLESDHIPNIDAILDFDQDTSLFVKLFFRPDYPNATYRLTPAAMDSILALLRLEDLEIHYRIFVSSHIGIDDLSLNDALIDWFVLHNDHSFVIFDACSL